MVALRRLRRLCACVSKPGNNSGGHTRPGITPCGRFGGMHIGAKEGAPLENAAVFSKCRADILNALDA